MPCHMPPLPAEMNADRGVLPQEDATDLCCGLSAFTTKHFSNTCAPIPVPICLFRLAVAHSPRRMPHAACNCMMAANYRPIGERMSAEDSISVGPVAEHLSRGHPNTIYARISHIPYPKIICRLVNGLLLFCFRQEDSHSGAKWPVRTSRGVTLQGHCIPRHMEAKSFHLKGSDPHFLIPGSKLNDP